MHKFLSDADGNIKVRDIRIVGFTMDKLLNIGMVHTQNAHVDAPSCPSLLHRFCRHVEHPHEADGSAGNTAGGIDRRPRTSQTGKGKACASSGFMNQGSLLDGLKNILHGILHRQNKAGGKLTQRSARIHQCG